MKDLAPEISDLIVDYDPATLARREVAKEAVVKRLRGRPRRIAAAMAEKHGMLDERVVDGVLVRAHLELQRLHEEFRVGALVRSLVAPLIAMVRHTAPARPIRVVDVGCGIGYITRWLAAHGGLGDDVELVGVDYNRALVTASAALAAEEGLACRFEVANAFRLDVPAQLYMSTGVLHHFRGPALVDLFREHARAGAFGFVHVDIRPSLAASIGSWVFHQARMREPLARFDGYWSAVRAHHAMTIVSATRDGAAEFQTATIDASPGLYMPVRIFQAVLGVRREHAGMLRGSYASFGRRFEAAA